MTLHEILQDFVNEPYENLVSMAKDAIAELGPIFNDMSKEGNGAQAIIAFMAVSLAVDGKLSELEYKFVCDVLGDFTYDEVKTIAAMHYSDEMVEALDDLADNCPTELKSKLVLFCCCFLAVDETISREEVAFVKKLCEAN